MNNTLLEFQNLVADTLEHIKSEYNDRKTLIISAENSAFFSSLKKVPIPQPEAPKTAPISKTVTPPLEVSKPLSKQEEPASIPPEAAKETPTPSPAPAVRPVVKPQDSIEFTEEMKKQIQKILPQVKIVRDVPNDEQATLLSEEWKQGTKHAEVLILSFSESKETDKFLYNVKKAIEAHFCSCAIIETKEWEEKKEWEAFFTIHQPKLIIASPELLKTKHLLHYYKENPSSKERFLHRGPLLLLLALPLYLKTPEQKKVLWNSLCNLLQKNP